MQDHWSNLIVVAGVASGVGKTSVAESVVRFLTPVCPIAAAKITVTHGDRGCPHGGKSCNVCGSLGGNFQVIDRQTIIEQSGTDTFRLRLAGADPVLWAITREEFVEEAWQSMANTIGSQKIVVVESNTLALKLKPKLVLMVVDPSISRRIWKQSAEILISNADYLIFNDRGPEQARDALFDEVSTERRNNGVLRVSYPSEAMTNPELSENLLTLAKVRSKPHPHSSSASIT